MPRIKIVPKIGHNFQNNGKKRFKPKTVFSNNTQVPNQLDSGSSPNVEQKEGKFQCEHCPRDFKELSHLKKHTEIHVKKNFPCETCGKSFLLKSHLSQHEKVHSDDQPSAKTDAPNVEQNGGKFKCSRCTRDFKDLYQLKKHENSHKSKVYTCATCGKDFVTKSYLSQHEKIHSDIRPFSCPMCTETAFKRKSELKRHLQAFHDTDVDKIIASEKETAEVSPSVPSSNVAQQQSKRQPSNDGRRSVACQFCDRRLSSHKCLLNHMKRFHEFEGSILDLQALNGDPTSNTKQQSSVSSPTKDPPSSAQRSAEPVLVNVFSIQGIRSRQSVRL